MLCFVALQCQNKVAVLLKGRVLVGHGLKNDLDVLMLSHPRHMIRDTACYRPLMRVREGGSEGGRDCRVNDSPFVCMNVQWDVFDA